MSYWDSSSLAKLHLKEPDSGVYLTMLLKQPVVYLVDALYGPTSEEIKLVKGTR